MSSNKRYHLLLSFLLLAASTGLMAQGTADTAKKKRGEYALVVYLGGGISFYSGDPGTPSGLDATQVNKISPSGTLRVMWHPDHLLRIGLETGWTNFYSYKIHNGNQQGQVNVRATPILLVFNMPVGRRINIFAGTGSYLVTTKLNYEVETTSKTMSLGWMVAASYLYPINKDLGIATELKWQDAFETKDATFNIQLQLRWKFLRW